MLGNQQQVQTFGDISMGDGNVFTINQIIQVTASEIQTRPLNRISPYRGLKRFESSDKDLFFGRDQLIASLIKAISQSNLILLLGASGSGKSSVVRAGLIPQLAERLGSNFQDFTLTPDRDPFESLRISLVSKGYKQAEAEIATKNDSESLIQVIKTLKNDQCQLLIFVDQFEEIFTLCHDLEKRQKFINRIVQFAESDDQSVKVVLAMRADFLNRFSPYPALGKIAEKNIHIVTDMHTDELRLAIEQPAANHGVVLQQGLVEEIIQDVQGQAGSLPLLQYTLDLLWKNDEIEDRTLNTQTYRNLGGVRGALQRHVDEIYKNLTPEEQETTKQIFLRLVNITGTTEQIDVSGKAVSRRANLSEFSENSQQLLNQFIDNKLLVSNRQEQSTVEIAHETLINSWDTLKKWIEDSQEIILIRNRLCEDAKNWKKALADSKVKAEDELWSGSKLAQVAELREKKEFDRLGRLSEEENQFIDASVELRERESRQEEERRLQEIRRTQKIAVALVAGSLLVAGSALFALKQSQIATRRQKEAEIIALAKEAQARFAAEPAIKHFIEGLQVGKQLQQLGSVDEATKREVAASLQNLVYGVREQNRLEKHTAQVRSASFSPDGQLIASAGRDQNINLWRSDGTFLQTLKEHKLRVNSLSFSPDSKIFASASSDRTIKLWNRDGKFIKTLQGHAGEVNSVTFSPDGKIIASASSDRTIKLWNRDGKFIKTLGQHSNAVNSIAFSPDNKIIASASGDSTVKLWHLDDKSINTLIEHSGRVLSVSFSADGTIIASASDDGTMKLWDRKGGLLNSFEGGNRVTFSPNRDSYIFASASKDGEIILWKIEADKTEIQKAIGLRNPQLIDTFRGHKGQITNLSFSRDGQMIVSAGDDKTIRVWTSLRPIFKGDTTDDNQEKDPSPLMVMGCNWLKDYFSSHPETSQDDLQLCGRSRTN
ncbi:NACHT and WD repeat domain-containing protein [Microcoleus sp. FACHB-672]|uniref:NACHT and WD repeat domain-containing protein n=1 Tax=Microcoleus sp. FACHB-672 TaxID=2692825 RepID=UPI001689C162|nr:WD40 repeat domain-containing protein [Microcoleus sp. FACHB-672]MBD2043917.1 WD40 repeat domain-containing protein [Microcoleus sp. FACHB-672]